MTSAGEDIEKTEPPCTGGKNVNWCIYMCKAVWRFLEKLKIRPRWDAWVAQSVERPTSAHVMTLQFVSSSPASGSVLTAQSLEPALDSVSPSLCHFPAHALSLCLSKMNKR